MPQLLFATSNAHKTDEVRQMLGPNWLVENLQTYPHLPIPDETGTTFEANARIKAEAASLALPDHLVLADDSGLEVDALNLAPGVISARYAGPNASDADNRARLKAELAPIAAANPELPLTGRFRCCMVLAKAGHTLAVENGTIEGRLLLDEQGSGGFGYDALFIPDGYQDSFGLLPAAVKNQLSHRARALAAMIQWLNTSSPA